MLSDTIHIKFYPLSIKTAKFTKRAKKKQQGNKFLLLTLFRGVM
jgi:hypothetical protein